MTEYEIHIEDINPCGGAAHARKEMIEALAESPEAYVQAHGRYPVLEIFQNPNGDTVIRTGNGKGYFRNYLFTL